MRAKQVGWRRWHLWVQPTRSTIFMTWRRVTSQATSQAISQFIASIKFRQRLFTGSVPTVVQNLSATDQANATVPRAQGDAAARLR